MLGLRRGRKRLMKNLYENEEKDLGWAAGLFDGEGCVTTLWPKRTQVRLEINMVHRPTLERFSSIVGGVVRQSYSKSTKQIKRKTQWRWRVCDNEAVNIAMVLQHYCTEKRQQLSDLINFKEAGDDIDRETFNDAIKAEKAREFI